MTGAGPDSVTVTFAVPALGATRVQVSERTPPAATCCWRVSTCAPKFTEATVTLAVVEMPTVRKRSVPDGTVNENAAGPLPATDPEATGVTSARAAAGMASETISAHSARTLPVINQTRIPACRAQ